VKEKYSDINITHTLIDQSDLMSLYEALGWTIYLSSKDQLFRAMNGSYAVLYAYKGNKLVGTGRLVSDGALNAYLCGLGIHPDYQGKGIGLMLSKKLIEIAEFDGIAVQLLCADHLVAYYEELGFEKFTVGMKKPL
jgi:ribosomal protein S18 acetylase RimI-like enzyme